MRKIQQIAVLILAVLVISSACGKDNPNAPDPGCGSSCNTGTNFEPVPTSRHYLKDSNGADTWMWVRLLSEPTPTRGSTIKMFVQGCLPTTCQTSFFRNFSVEYGADNIPNPNTSTYFVMGFSEDCQTISTTIWSPQVKGSGVWQTDPGFVYAFYETPKCVVVSGSFQGDVAGPFGSFSGQTGAQQLLLDYK